MMPGFMAQGTARVYSCPQLNRLGDSSGRIFGAMEQQAFADRVPTAERVRAAAVAGIRALVDLVLPPQCLACTRPVGIEGGLCPACWSRLRLIERPFCAQLGTPFAYDLGEGALSAEAIADPPPFERCRAVAAFDDVARNLVHGLKYRDRLDLAAWMAGWMARAGRDLLDDADVIVPVPLHSRRLWRRRFNQSASLARAVADKAGKPMVTTALCRIRPTPQQVGLSAAERDRNVRGAFKVMEDQRVTVAGRRVLLVDDVYTTGATVKAATRALERAGAAAVDVLVFARVVRGAG
jgi:ComF family protein